MPRLFGGNMTQEVHTREQAAALGLAKYWTGRPCRKGHHDFRYTVSGACCSCVAGYRTRFQVKRNTATIAGTKGLVPYHAVVHPDDVPAVQQLVDALALARSLTP